ncbi:MAG: hypothetical protein D6791_12660 [Chloroflexi bacterium]|nr:MAG: hypothetical protein D6791_12660 [Chloroflexota bacterium]
MRKGLRQAGCRQAVLGGLLLGFIITLLWTLDFCLGWRLPKEVVLVVSRCWDVRGVEVSPDGRHMLISVGYFKSREYLVDIINGKWVALEKGSYSFLDNTHLLVWFWRDRKPYLFDIRNHSLIPLTPLQIEADWQPIFAQADAVLLVENLSTVVALDPERERGYTLSNPYNPYFTEALLREHHIPFRKITPLSELCASNKGCPSHNGRLLASQVNIYTVDRDLVASQYGLDLDHKVAIFEGWAYDDSGVYFTYGGGYIIEGGIIMPIFIRSPGGILKLRIPEAYLSPEVRAAQAREAAMWARQHWLVVGRIWGRVFLLVAVIVAVRWLWRQL